jgi:hypothetical protein
MAISMYLPGARMLWVLSTVVFSKLMNTVPPEGMDSAALIDQVVDGLADLLGIDAADQMPLDGPISQRMLEPLRENAAVFSTRRTMSVGFFVGCPPFEKVISRRVRVLATPRCFQGLFQQIGEFGVGGHMFQCQGNVAHDGGQQVVVVVGDTTGQGAMDSSWRICRFRSSWRVAISDLITVEKKFILLKSCMRLPNKRTW